MKQNEVLRYYYSNVFLKHMKNWGIFRDGCHSILLYKSCMWQPPTHTCPLCILAMSVGEEGSLLSHMYVCFLQTIIFCQEAEEEKTAVKITNQCAQYSHKTCSLQTNAAHYRIIRPVLLSWALVQLSSNPSSKPVLSMKCQRDALFFIFVNAKNIYGQDSQILQWK